MRKVSYLAMALLIGAACSQRVTPEEEFAKQERERPVVSAEGANLPPAAGAPARPMDGGPAPGSAGAPASADQAAQTIRGTIEAPGDAAGEVLFLFVRAVGATGGPPLAVQRIPAPRFPREFAIGPQDAMMDAGPFPDRVTVEARLDRDGNAMTEDPEDFSASTEAAPGATGVVLALSSRGA